MHESKITTLQIESRSRRYVATFNKKKLHALSKEVILAIGYEAGLRSRAGLPTKPRVLTTKVSVKPREQ